ncbi:DUF4837 family protein [Aquimarina sp. MMG016]|uniref:DUF4837 family protein n=1 Tax=Aquimarina sp. MMG016 TaxID=2822690 RepID=UPI001B3A7386|nr:DUF4837 family protein [Aquimarina sp. MMG016]MBQ4820060.1 DUF4837 family protein [Aquimarina sp. MMG016]
MKKIAFAIVCALCIVSCTQNNKETAKKKHEGALASSVGKINDLSVIIDNDLWEGRVGDSIRKYFGAEVPGLPQQEPLFSMRQMPPEIFSGFAQKGRIFLRIEKGDLASAEILNNKYASPQLGALITGTTDDDIIELIRDNSESIISKYKFVETREKQKRIRKSLERMPQLKEKMGITLSIPTAYRIATEEDKFFWIRKDIPKGTSDLLIYELPLGSVPKDSTTISKIIKIRDSIGANKIPTSSGKFITEQAYAPYLYEIKMDGNFAYETKGTWEIKDRYMAGPFVNYVIDDIPNNRQLVLEGFVFAPSTDKRDNMFELEAIMKSVKFE